MPNTLTLVISLPVAAAIGFLIGWLIHGVRSRELVGALRSRLENMQSYQERASHELEELKISLREQQHTVLQHSSARAAAEAIAARVPELDARVLELLRNHAADRDEIMRLSRADAETAQLLKGTQAQLQAAESEKGELSRKSEDLSEQLSQAAQRRAALEAELARVPELQGQLGSLQASVEELTGELMDLRDRYARSQAELTADRDALNVARNELARARDQLSTLQASVTQLSVERTDLSTRLEAEVRAGKERLELLSEAKQALADSFKALSSDALKSNNQSFIDLAKATLERFQESARGDLEARHKAVDQLVQPIRQSLEKVDNRLGEIETQRVASYSALNEQLRGLVETHLPTLRSETANLVKALRQPTVRGRWGELQLRRVVELAGMLDHCDFIEQESHSTEEGRLRPDVIVNLPGGRRIVVDAKAPIAAYLEANEAQDEVVQRERIAQHAQQVRSHITALGRKGYWEQLPASPDFVVMFIPGEAFFSAALQGDPSLIECGVSENVIPATPTTLIALLRAVAYGWRQEKLAESAEEVAKLGKEIYERICTLGEHWSDVGDRLRKTVDAYNSATSSLEARVIVSARRFRELKVSAEGREMVDLKQIEVIPRTPQAGELLAITRMQQAKDVDSIRVDGVDGTDG
jgi:DNA recombination protein RmuC